MIAEAWAHPNIALVKYWGKRQRALNLPLAGSLALTVGGLTTHTRVEPAPGPEDEVSLDGAPCLGEERRRILEQVDGLRALAGRQERLRITTVNSFPTAAGLASSASGMAALVLALSTWLELRLSLQALSTWARRGSGSACRSLHGGFVEWRCGERDDGEDSCAVPLAPASWWDLRWLVVVVERGRKDVSSRDGMERSAATSPLMSAFVRQSEGDLGEARRAITHRDLPALGGVMERSCGAMIGVMLSSAPPLLYWQAPTLEVLHQVLALRARGASLWYTTDAGPNVKALCPADQAEELAGALRPLPGVREVLICPPGGPAWATLHR